MNASVKRILWFAHYGPECPSHRYRAAYPLEYLAENENIQYDLYYPERSLRGAISLISIFFKALFSRSTNTLIVVQKVCSSGPYGRLMQLLFRLKRNTLFDLDDAEYLRQDDRILNDLICQAAGCHVGSMALKKYCEQLNENVTLATSPVIEHRYRKMEKTKGPLHIGWVGDTGNGLPQGKEFAHKRSLFEILFPAVIEANMEMKLTLIGVKRQEDAVEIKNYFAGHPKVEVRIPENLDWRNDEWVYKEIKEFDFGVSPLLDHPFNRAKSAFKSKQYLSVGVPVVASGIGENDKFVHHQVNGIICKTKDDFVRAIRYASNMSDDQYREWSEAAWCSTADFSMKKYGEIIHSVVTGG